MLYDLIRQLMSLEFELYVEYKLKNSDYHKRISDIAFREKIIAKEPSKKGPSKSEGKESLKEIVASGGNDPKEEKSQEILGPGKLIEDVSEMPVGMRERVFPFLGMFSRGAVSRYNPLFDKFTDKYIDKSLDGIQEDSNND